VKDRSELVWRITLLNIGAKPINNVVDVNQYYVLHEMGSRFHAFDADNKLFGDQVFGEAIVLEKGLNFGNLDGVGADKLSDKEFEWFDNAEGWHV